MIMISFTRRSKRLVYERKDHGWFWRSWKWQIE
jgi:hypothetical protein